MTRPAWRLGAHDLTDTEIDAVGEALREYMRATRPDQPSLDAEPTPRRDALHVAASGLVALLDTMAERGPRRIATEIDARGPGHLGLYKCAGEHCPGYTWAASTSAHPSSCVVGPHLEPGQGPARLLVVARRAVDELAGGWPVYVGGRVRGGLSLAVVEVLDELRALVADEPPRPLVRAVRRLCEEHAETGFVTAAALVELSRVLQSLAYIGGGEARRVEATVIGRAIIDGEPR